MRRTVAARIEAVAGQSNRDRVREALKWTNAKYDTALRKPADSKDR